jgi:uncharacterized protein (TIGR03067 family)
MVQATYAVDRGAKPRTLDYKDKSKSVKAIYVVEGDILKICESDQGKEQPTSFDTKKGSPWTVTVFRRETQADTKLAAARKEEFKKWKGDWKVVSAEHNGEKQPFPANFNFNGEDISILLEGQEGFGTLFLDPMAKVKSLSMELGYFTTPGIYAFDGDTLKICLGGMPWRVPSERPKEFKSTKSASLFVLKRTKGEDAKQRAARAEGLKKLQGTWELVKLISDGEAEKLDKEAMVFEGRVLIHREGDKEERASYLIDPISKPMRFSLQVGDFFIPGIYELDGDTLKLCTGGDKEGPKEAVSKKGSRNILFVYKRKKEQ